MPAIPLSPEDLERQANLKTDFVELHFQQPEGQSSPKNGATQNGNTTYSLVVTSRYARLCKLRQG